MQTLHLVLIAISILATISINSVYAPCAIGVTCGDLRPPHEFDPAFFKTDHATYPILYHITNGKLVASLVDLPAKELIFAFNATDNGQLTVQLQRKIIDSTRDGKDKPYLVFAGTQETGLNRINANEIQNNNETRTLAIDFTKADNQIGIVGTYFIENNSTSRGWNQFGAFTPLQQYKKGFDAQDIICKQDLQLVIKSEDKTLACVKPDTVQKLVERGWGWAMQPTDSLKSLLPNRIPGLENDMGVATLGNQTYYFETPNYTNTAYYNPVQISFHDVVFTLFPPGFRGGLPTNFGGVAANGCGGSYFWTDAKFPDGTHVLLNIFAITSMSQECLALPEPTHFSTHTNPQAGLTFYDGKMKLLVRMEKATHDARYLSQTVDEWKNKTPRQLDAYYKKYNDTFYTELGSFLIKNEMKKELERQKIQNMYDDFKVFPGMILDSLPPHISYDSVVNATDGNSYLLLGGVSANKIESLKIIKLVFDKDVLYSLSTGKKPSYTNQFEKAPKVVISERSGTNAIVEPYDLALDLDKNNLVTFYNNLTVPIRIQPYGSGLTVDEGGLGWKSKVIPPNEMVALQFNKTGYYEWNARSPPQGSENWWDSHGSGQIAAFSQYHDNSTSREKLRMAQVFVTDSDIPWYSSGLDNYGHLEIGLYESVYHMIPDAQKYYAARAMQLIPFGVPIIIASPSFTG